MYVTTTKTGAQKTRKFKFNFLKPKCFRTEDEDNKNGV